MAEEQKRGPGRPRKEQPEQAGGNDFETRRQEAKQSSEFGGASYVGMDETLDILNQRDERLEDRRPGTLANRDTGEAFEDNRKFAGDVGKASNQMIGRVFITENASPHPGLDHPYPVAWPNVQDHTQLEEGEKVVLLRGIMASETTKHQPGTIVKLPRAQAKKYVNLGVAKFVEDDDE
jgi:hypothetical protein